MNVPVKSSAPTDIRIPRAWLVYGVGALMGLLWVAPLFGPPGADFTKQNNGASVLRFARLLVPLFVFLLVRRSAYETILSAALVRLPRGRLSLPLVRLLAVILVLGLIPLLAGVLTANSLFLVSAVFPLTLSLITLVGIILLDEETLTHWVVGITAVTTLFLVLGMVTTQLAPTNYYGRPRVPLGFIHPIYTASVIIGALMLAYVTLGERVRQMKRARRRVSAGCFVGAILLLLLAAQDRNQLLMVCIILFCLWLLPKVRRPARFSIFALLLLVPVLLYLVVILGSSDNPVWAALDTLSSGRLGFFQRILIANLDLSDPRTLVEPSVTRLSAFSQLISFAATDSVYLSFLINYGLLSVVGLVGFLLFLGYRLSAYTETAGALSVLCGLVLFYGLDAPGLTTSNLILFILLAYTVRTAIALRLQS